MRIILLFIILGFLTGMNSKIDDMDTQRKNMVETQIKARGIKDPRVLNALLKVKRHLFLPQEMAPYAYQDNPLPIGEGQTISQPYIVALMTELARLTPESKVLEIGTGSGYQAAILAEIAKEVYTIEIIERLANNSEKLLRDLGYRNIKAICADGYKGWPEFAPFDAILVTAAAPKIPMELIKQLKPGGRMVIPLGDFYQELYVLTKNVDGSFSQEQIIPVRFVPLVNKPATKDS